MDVTQNRYVDECWEDSQLVGESTLKDYQFSFRTSDQCGATRFNFEPPYWMELFNSAQVELLDTWNEQVYSYQRSVSQLSFPGYAAWTSGTVTEVVNQLYDKETGNDTDFAGVSASTPNTNNNPPNTNTNPSTENPTIGGVPLSQWDTADLVDEQDMLEKEIQRGIADSDTLAFLAAVNAELQRRRRQRGLSATQQIPVSQTIESNAENPATGNTVTPEQFYRIINPI
jgi:hypothetical protein